MTVWIALLRAVNLGAHNRVPMAELRALLAQGGFGDVRTYLQSGNVAVTAATADRDEVAHAVEQVIADGFEVATEAIVRSAAELDAVVAAHPFGADTSQTYVSFLAAEPDAEAEDRLAALEAGADRAVLDGTQLFLLYPNGVSGARLTAPRLERALGVPGTIRNWRTVTALAELASG